MGAVFTDGSIHNTRICIEPPFVDDLFNIHKLIVLQLLFILCLFFST